MALKHVNYHVKQITSPGSMHDTGCLGLVHWDDPEGKDREGSGKRVFRMGNTCTPMVDSCQCMAKPKKKKKITYFHLSNDFLLVYGVYNTSFQMTVVFVYPSVYRSTVYNSQDMEAT